MSNDLFLEEINKRVERLEAVFQASNSPSWTPHPERTRYVHAAQRYDAIIKAMKDIGEPTLVYDLIAQLVFGGAAINMKRNAHNLRLAIENGIERGIFILIGSDLKIPDQDLPAGGEKDKLRDRIQAEVLSNRWHITFNPAKLEKPPPKETVGRKKKRGS